MPKFTKGKWKIDDLDTTDIISCHSNGRVIIALVNNTDKDEGKANSRLIASAPDMYNLLKAMTYRTCNNCRGFKKQARELLKSIVSED